MLSSAVLSSDGLREAEACVGMPSASHRIGGHVTLLGPPLTISHSISERGLR